MKVFRRCLTCGRRHLDVQGCEDYFHKWPPALMFQLDPAFTQVVGFSLVVAMSGSFFVYDVVQGIWDAAIIQGSLLVIVSFLHFYIRWARKRWEAQWAAIRVKTDANLRLLREETSDSITCPRCGQTSYNPKDIEYRYCGACHQYHAFMDPEPA